MDRIGAQSAGSDDHQANRHEQIANRPDHSIESKGRFGGSSLELSADLASARPAKIKPTPIAIGIPPNTAIMVALVSQPVQAVVEPTIETATHAVQRPLVPVISSPIANNNPPRNCLMVTPPPSPSPA